MATNDQVEHSIEDENSSLDQKISKPCYYPSQISVSGLLFERIELILWHYHEKRLRDFKKFDFRIYTARFNELEEQGIERLSEQGAECFGSEHYERPEKLQELAKSKFWKYGKSKDSDRNLEDLKKDVEKNLDKLFLIVADEGDWGASGENSANNKLVNCWDDKKNVIVLLVTATPWSLLTKDTRVSDLAVARKIEDNQQIKVFEKDGQCLVDENNIDVTNLVRQKKKLHVMKWDENYEDRLTKGFLVKLRVPQEVGKEQTWLKLGMPNDENYETLVGTSKKEEAVSLLLFGKDNVVQIATEDRKKRCVAVRRNDCYFLAFHSSSDELPEGWEFICDSFLVILNYGESIFKFCLHCADKSMRFYLKYVSASGVTFNENLENSSLDDVFLIEEASSCPQYLSLNFYFNTIRNKDLHEQLIREDKNYQEICTGANFLRPFQVLASEYAYYVVLIDSIRTFHLDESSIQGKDPCEALQRALEQFIESRSKKLEALKEKLLLSKISEIPEISEIFQSVVDEIEKKYYLGLKNLLKPNENHDLNFFIQNLVLMLIHAKSGLSKAELLSIWNLVNDKFNNFKDFIISLFEKKETVLCQSSETFKIVNDLFQKEKSGPMKIIRLEEKEESENLHKILVVARTVGFIGNGKVRRDSYPFEIIRLLGTVGINGRGNRNSGCYDIWECTQQVKCSNYEGKSGKKCNCETFVRGEEIISCSNCSHPHNVIKLLSDLERLPCIVILVDKARRGITLPLSFNVLDLRLIKLNTFTPLVQQLGRMCQYREKKEYHSLPYALLVHELVTELKDTIKTSAVFEDYNIKRDHKINAKNVAGPKNADHGNTKVDNNKLLLWAEPQIGKTGAYLNLISRLRKTIENPTEGEEEISSDLSSSDEDTSDLSDDDEEDTSETNWKTKDEWEYPHWNFMRTSKPLDKTIGKNKYDRKFESYKYGESPRSRSQHSQDQVPKSKNEARKKIKEREIDVKDGPVAYCYYEHSCSDCKSSAWFVKRNLKITGFEESVKLSVPQHERFQPLLNKLNSIEKQFSSMNISGETIQKDPCLVTWIFNPTYRRATKATINYHHTMSGANYVQILVVRGEEFDTYAELWQTTHAVLQLPETTEGVDVKTGGIGYARRFIQLFAEHFNLSKIFVLDDNIYQIYQVKFAEQDEEVQQTDEKYRLDKVTFWSVLKHLESFFDCSQPLPVKDKFDKYSMEETYCCNQSNGIHTYTGTPNLYGILGVMKSRRQRVGLQGFKRGHVHSLVLLNIPKLKSEKIKYKPFRVYEDLDINNQCDEKGVIVCKFNQFRMLKKQLKSNIMNEDKKLCKKATNTKSIDPSSPKVKSEVMKQHIQSVDNYIASLDGKDFVIYNKRTGKTRNLSKGMELGDEEEIRSLNQIRSGGLYDHVIQTFEIKRQGQIKNESENQEELQKATE